MTHFVSPNTQHTLFKHQRDEWKPSGAPCLLPWKSNRRGQPDPFTFVSLNSFNSSWREEGGCKTNERSEQRSSVCPRNNSISSKDSQCRQQKVNVISTFYDKGHMDVSEEGKRRRERRGVSLSFVMSSRSVKGRWHMFVAANDLVERIASLRCFEKVWHGLTNGSMWWE